MRVIFVSSIRHVLYFFFLWALRLLRPSLYVLRLYMWLYDGCCFIYKAVRKTISRQISNTLAGRSKPGHRYLLRSVQATQTCLTGSMIPLTDREGSKATVGFSSQARKTYLSTIQWKVTWSAEAPRIQNVDWRHSHCLVTLAEGIVVAIWSLYGGVSIRRQSVRNGMRHRSR